MFKEKIYPSGTIPWIILENHKSCKDREHPLMVLLDAQNRLKSEGYYDDITLSVNKEQLNLFDDVTRYRLRREEFFKLNIHAYDGIELINLFGIFKNKTGRILGIMIIILDNVLREVIKK